MLSREEITPFAKHWIEFWNAHDLETIMTHYEDNIQFLP